MPRRDGLELLIHMPDQDGLFAAIVIALDRLGMSVQQARVLDAPGDAVYDTFHVLPVDPRVPIEAEQLAAALRQVLSGDVHRLLPARRSQPRHLRHFRVPPRLDFTEMPDGTRIGLTCTDRPGLLADVARVLREHQLRVHDARIATFGERAEDLLLVSDEHDAPLSPDQCDALRTALLTVLDGVKA